MIDISLPPNSVFKAFVWPGKTSSRTTTGSFENGESPSIRYPHNTISLECSSVWGVQIRVYRLIQSRGVLGRAWKYQNLGGKLQFFKTLMEGSAILWPYLPCVRMPMKMRPREWDALALLSSSDELISLREEEEQDKESPGVHLESATASGTTLGMLVRDLSELRLDGPAIPDPERIRLLRHAENSRGEMPIFSIEPGIDDQKWADWQSRWADEQVRFRNLIATFGRNRRWAKTRIKAVSRIQKPPFAIPNDLVAAAAVCAAWWAEEFISLTPELSRERDERYASRIRGAISNLRETADE